MESLATSQAADMKLSHIMTDITNINDVIAFGDQWFSFYELNDDLTEFSIDRTVKTSSVISE